MGGILSKLEEGGEEKAVVGWIWWGGKGMLGQSKEG